MGQKEDKELAFLDEYLMSDDAPKESMQLSDLDGFLTAVAIGPELILPSEWLPKVWGGEEPAFSSAEQAARVNRCDPEPLQPDFGAGEGAGRLHPHPLGA